MNNSEYLKSLDPHELAEWFNAEHAEPKPVGALGRHAEHEMDSDDSREKLEADVLKHYTHTTSTLMWPEDANIKTKWVSVSMDTVLEWLDRQEAITRATEQHEWIAQANGLIHEAQSEAKRLRAELDKRDQGIARLKRRRDELQARVDYLEARAGRLDAELSFAKGAIAEERDYWKQQVQLCMDSAYPPSHSPERRYNPDVMAYPDRNGCTTPSTLVAALIDGMRDTLAEQSMAAVELNLELEKAKEAADRLLVWGDSE